MQEATCDNTRRGHTIIKVLGITVLVFVMLVGIAGAERAVYNFHNGTVFVIDTATNKVTATVEVGINPLGVAINPEGTRVYVMNQDNGTLSVIDTTINNATATINIGNGTEGVAVTQDGSKVYTANEHGSEGVAVTPDGKKVYVTTPAVILYL